MKQSHAMIARAYRNHEPLKVIAGRFGIDQSTVTRIAKRLGVSPRRPRMNQPTVHTFVYLLPHQVAWLGPGNKSLKVRALIEAEIARGGTDPP